MFIMQYFLISIYLYILFFLYLLILHRFIIVIVEIQHIKYLNSILSLLCAQQVKSIIFSSLVRFTSRIFTHRGPSNVFNFNCHNTYILLSLCFVLSSNLWHSFLCPLGSNWWHQSFVMVYSVAPNEVPCPGYCTTRHSLSVCPSNSQTSYSSQDDTLLSLSLL